MRRMLLAAGAAAVPTAAWAHGALGEPTGFGAGFLHPLAGADHLLAMVAVGLWGAILGRPLVAALPVVFPAFMAAGALFGLAGTVLPMAEAGVSASLLGLGLALALAWRAPVLAACALTGVFGFFHGYAHGRELPLSADPAAYCAGFVLATGLLHAAGIALGAARRLPWGDRATRIAGVSMAGLGAHFLLAAASP
jgi:urease accessory protein